MLLSIIRVIISFYITSSSDKFLIVYMKSTICYSIMWSVVIFSQNSSTIISCKYRDCYCSYSCSSLKQSTML